MKQIVLIACGKKKLDEPAAAKDLYQGDLFKLSRRYAEACGAEWFILSALHCLLNPNSVIKPYNCTLKGSGKWSLQQWALGVRNRLVPRIGPVEVRERGLLLLAGNDYAEPLEDLFGDYDIPIERPLKGLGIGLQKKRLKEMIEAVTTQAA